MMLFIIETLYYQIISSPEFNDLFTSIYVHEDTCRAEALNCLKSVCVVIPKPVSSPGTSMWTKQSLPLLRTSFYGIDIHFLLLTLKWQCIAMAASPAFNRF